MESTELNGNVIPSRAYPSNQMLIHWPYRGNNFIHVMMPEGVKGRRESEEHRTHLFNGWGRVGFDPRTPRHASISGTAGDVGVEGAGNEVSADVDRNIITN